MITLARPYTLSYPDGQGFYDKGEHWGYHFDKDGIFRHGRLCQTCGAVVLNAYPAKCACGGTPLGVHAALDIKTPFGTPLQAPIKIAHIIRAGWQDDTDHSVGYGLSVMFETIPVEYEADKCAKLILTAAHLSEIFMNKGASMDVGDTFGRSGNSGNSWGAHSHWRLELPSPVYPRQPIPFKWADMA